MIRIIVFLDQILQKFILWLSVSGKKAQLHEGNIPEEPFSLFARWYHDAKNSGVYLYEAMALSTGNEKIACRMVLLKGYDRDGFVFFTNYQSRKAKEIEANPYGAFTFAWNILGRQVRIEGKMEKISEKESDEYFATRPRGSQIGAWASEQSAALAGREALEKKVKYYEDKFRDLPVPRPPHWGGYRLKPSVIEFWQARINRLHDRIRYTLLENACLPDRQGSWRRERLAP